MADILVGPHVQILAELKDTFNSMLSDEHTSTAPRIVLLTGASGSGKSRIVQEFYDYLRANRPGPGVGPQEYWPALIDPGRAAGSGVDPLPGRKLLGPNPETATWPEDSLPSFGWWTFNCQQMATGDRQNVVVAAKAQLKAHATPLTVACGVDDGAFGLAKEGARGLWRRIRDEVVGTAKDYPVDAAINALPIQIPYLKTLIGWGVDGLKYLKNRQEQRTDIGRTVDTGATVRKGNEDAATELAEAIRSMTRSRIPAVIAIEDMHDMGAELATFIDAVSAVDPECPVLVVGTVWPEGMSNKDFDQWFTRRTSTPEAIKTLEVPTMSPNDLAQLVMRLTKGTDPAEAERVAAGAPSPLAVRFYLSSKSIGRKLRRSGGAVTSEFPAITADVIRDVLEERWKTIPPETRDVLAVALAADPLNKPLEGFPPSVIAAAAPASWAELPADTAREALAEAVVPASWCKLTDELEHFFEPEMVDIARKAEELDDLDPEDIAEVREAVVRGILAWVGEQQEKDRQNAAKADSPDEQPEFRLEDTRSASLVTDWYFALTGDSPSPQTLEVAALLAFRAKEEARTNHVRLAAATAREALPIIKNAPDTWISVDGLNFRADAASWAADTGDYASALQLYDQLIEDSAARYGRDNNSTLLYRGERANVKDLAGQHEEALADVEEVIAVREADPDTQPITITHARYFRGKILHSLRRFEDAQAELETAAEDYRKHYGPDDPRMFLDSSGYAIRAQWGAAKSPAELESVIETARAFNNEHNELLNDFPMDRVMAQAAIAYSLKDLGKHREARNELTEILRESALDPRVPLAIGFRRDAANEAIVLGNYAQGLAEFTALEPDAALTHGDDSDDVAQVLDGQARALEGLERFGEAITIRDRMITLATFRHRYTPKERLNVERQRVNDLARLDRIDEAKDLHERLLNDVRDLDSEADRASMMINLRADSLFLSAAGNSTPGASEVFRKYLERYNATSDFWKSRLMWLESRVQ